MFSSQEKSAGRFFLKALAAKKAKLPASMDACMGYFTGYKDSKIVIENVDDFLGLVAKCIEYCRLLHDKDTLQLLFYALAKRYYHANSTEFFTAEANVFQFWDILSGDGAGVYQQNKSLQVTDMCYLFEIWLTVLNSEQYKLKKSELYFGILKPWEPQNAPNIKQANPKIWLEEHIKYTKENLFKDEKTIYFTRGGGLYCFLDILKGLCSGLNDDNSPLKGVYVTPSIKFTERGERDELYAYEYIRARRHGDIPSFQSGVISSERLFLVNHNLYEAFIKSEDLTDLYKGEAKRATEKLCLHPLAVDYRDRMTHLVGKKDLDDLVSCMPADDKKTHFYRRLEVVLKILKYDFYLSAEENQLNKLRLIKEFEYVFSEEQCQPVDEDKKLSP